MPQYETHLSKQEIKWILDRRTTRLTDEKPALIYPMGAERYLSLVLCGNKKSKYKIQDDVIGKNILIVPGYGNTAFLFAQAGAESVTVCDKDPVTIAWVKAFKKYYNYREYNKRGEPYPSVGELLTALTRWYPPLIDVPANKLRKIICWAINPKELRRAYIFYMLTLVRDAIQKKVKGNFELNKKIEFFAEEVDHLSTTKKCFDIAFVPYLLGVKNGIETEKDIVAFIKQLTGLVPSGNIVVSPTRSSKEFHMMGERYFVTTEYSNIQGIPGIKEYFVGEDKYWFKTQGLAIFRNPG